jgi:phycobilisome core component
MKDIVKGLAADAGMTNTAFIDQPFDHMTRELSEQDV